MNKLKKIIPLFVWLFILFWGGLFELLGGGLSAFASGGKVSVSQDRNMQTTKINTQIKVGEDQSYTVTEDISVNFLNPRHGIYRYIPEKGIVSAADSNIPYIADIKLLDANTKVSENEKNGNIIYQMGDANHTVHGDNHYSLTYQVTPKFHNNDYQNAYYNVFPIQWQNAIPLGSTFSISFPKDFNHDSLQLYYGSYGENNDASDIVTTTWDGNVLSGTLNRNLALGEGITFYAKMSDGYFTNVHQIKGVELLLLIPTVIIFGIIFLLFFFFGRDEKIIPSIQYQPPDDLDSASVGYVIDGSIEDKDLLSLIIYWADHGYLSIAEKSEDGLILYKKKELPKNAPSYELTIFRGIFENCQERDIDSLQYKFDGILATAKDQLHSFFKKDGIDLIYTKKSKVARFISMFITTIPLLIFILYTNMLSLTSTSRFIIDMILWVALLVGMIMFCHTIDKWYAISKGKRKVKIVTSLTVSFASTALYIGTYFMRVMKHEIFDYVWVLIIVGILTFAMVIMTGYMKKRTAQCTEWMGRLAGLRDFIETAELDRMNELAKDHPEWFYHIIPYAYVFGLSDVFAEKLKGIGLAAPEWYQPYRQYSFFDFYMFNRCMNHSLSHTVSTLTVPKPSSPSSGNSFGGGSFGGGGFSGGGFGGGGGGSW